MQTTLVLLAGFALIAGHPRAHAQVIAKPEPIPADQLGAVAGKQYQGDGLSVTATPEGASLRCVFQRMEGQATREGLWLTSTAGDSKGGRFRLVSRAVGREGTAQSLSRQGAVEVTGKLARFIRPGLTEEYSVSMDGVRQDFIIGQRPVGEGNLRVELDLAGAKAEPLPQGVRLTLDGSARKIAYSRLRVTDTTGRELLARIGVVGAVRSADSLVRESAGVAEGHANKAVRAPALAVVVDDAGAVYPVRIDPTFSDANWISLGGFPGANGDLLAAVVDGLGSLYIGGTFTVVGDVIATNIAKWNGSSWSALGSGIGNTVYTLAVSGSDVYAGGYFTNAGSIAANQIAKWNGSGWSVLGSGLSGNAFPLGVRTLAVSGSDLYVGGNFTMVGGKVSTYAAKAILTVAGGTLGGFAYSPATGVTFTFGNATAGFPYRIQSSTSLAIGSWTDLTNFTYTGPVMLNDASAIGAPKKFYRAATP